MCTNHTLDNILNNGVNLAAADAASPAPVANHSLYSACLQVHLSEHGGG